MLCSTHPQPPYASWRSSSPSGRHLRVCTGAWLCVSRPWAPLPYGSKGGRPCCLVMVTKGVTSSSIPLSLSSAHAHCGQRSRSLSLDGWVNRPSLGIHASPPLGFVDATPLRSLSSHTLEEQGTSVSCTTWGRPSVGSDDMEARSENDVDESASASTSRRKEPWLIRLMFGFSKSEKPWKVPWTSFTIIQVMFLWFCTFWLVGSWIIPFAAHYVGCSKDTLTFRGQALYSLITDIAEGTVGLGILHRCLARFQPLPKNWFPFSWRGQWYVDVLLGCLTFPVVNRLSQLNLELLPFPSPLTSSYEQSIMTRDPIASVLYAIVVSVCCPIWEEVIFRGFLLPSLTRYLPMWASVFVSAVVFGLAHFNVQRMLPLTFLGLVMGIMFVRSQNLLSSMLLHSLWNGFVFMGLLR